MLLVRRECCCLMSSARARHALRPVVAPLTCCRSLFLSMARRLTTRLPVPTSLVAASRPYPFGSRPLGLRPSATCVLGAIPSHQNDLEEHVGRPGAVRVLAAAFQGNARHRG